LVPGGEGPLASNRKPRLAFGDDPIVEILHKIGGIADIRPIDLNFDSTSQPEGFLFAPNNP
jgi:hypothetical protein